MIYCIKSYPFNITDCNTIDWVATDCPLWRWLPHRFSKRQSQPTIVLLKTDTTPYDQPSTKQWLTWVTTISSPSQYYTDPDDQPTINVDSPGSQPTAVLLRTTPTRTNNQLQTLTHRGYKQQQFFSILHQPGPSTNCKHWLTWVTTNNSPSQNYTNLDNQPTTNID